MFFDNKSISEINEADIQLLIGNEVQESKNLDYKEKLPENSDKAKKEFLADVSSFANSNGGYLIFGRPFRSVVSTRRFPHVSPL